jgi:hypothetical protein
MAQCHRSVVAVCLVQVAQEHLFFLLLQSCMGLVIPH